MPELPDGGRWRAVERLRSADMPYQYSYAHMCNMLCAQLEEDYCKVRKKRDSFELAKLRSKFKRIKYKKK